MNFSLAFWVDFKENYINFQWQWKSMAVILIHTVAKNITIELEKHIQIDRFGEKKQLFKI